MTREETHSSGCEITPVLSVLEAQLVELDRLEASIAAAHLDACIQQLRFERINRSDNP
ncbi:MAG: hypothetical protein AAF687_07530 [Pseudomonadota bacterium]